MKIIGIGQLYHYVQRYPDTKNWLDNWITDVKYARWQTPHDIRKRYATASIIGKGTVIFNVRGNNHRLITTVSYQTGAVVVEWIGTHVEYTRKSAEIAR